MKILVVNCGSSSLKYQLIDMETEEVMAKGYLERIGLGGSFLTHTVNGEKHRIEKEIANHEEAMNLLLEQLLDKEYELEITEDGHALVHLPNLKKVIIEKMLSKYGEPYYGAATYIVDEDYFEQYREKIITDNKINRSKLSDDIIFRGVDRVIHSPTGWGKGIKKVLNITEETKTPEELQQIDEAVKAVEESRRKIERE